MATTGILCPSCGKNITADIGEIEAEEGPLAVDESFDCCECEAVLAVVSVDPLELESVDEDDLEALLDEDEYGEESEDDDDDEDEDEDTRG